MKDVSLISEEKLPLVIFVKLNVSDRLKKSTVNIIRAEFFRVRIFTFC